MEQYLKLPINNFEEITDFTSSGKRVILQEFHVPDGYTASDFGIIASVKGANTNTFSIAIKADKTNNANITDLADNAVIDIPRPNCLSILIIKPQHLQDINLSMSIHYRMY